MLRTHHKLRKGPFEAKLECRLRLCGEHSGELDENMRILLDYIRGDLRSASSVADQDWAQNRSMTWSRKGGWEALRFKFGP